jgi:hypothetical protein
MSDDEWANYDSGPFCEHWGTPGDCSECDREKQEPFKTLAERAIRALAEFDEAGAEELMQKLKELSNE